MYTKVRRFCHSYRDGFTLVEVLFSLSITLMIVMSLTGLYSLIQYSQRVLNYDEDLYIAAKQISQSILGTTYISVDERYCYYDYDGKEMSIELDNGRLVKKDGFEIFAFEIDDLSFSIENELIYMTLSRNDNEYKFLVTYAKEKVVEDDVVEEKVE